MTEIEASKLRAASSQMGFGHAPAAGAASTVERRWKQEEDLDSLGSAGVVASGAREVKVAHRGQGAREQGDMFIVAGNANFDFVDAGGAPSAQRRVDQGVMDTNVNYHHQEVQAGTIFHTWIFLINRSLVQVPANIRRLASSLCADPLTNIMAITSQNE